MSGVRSTFHGDRLVARLAAAGIATPDAEAGTLRRHVEEHGGELEELVARRLAREPLQHVLGVTGFRWLELRCVPGVLVPRPETEVVAGVAVAAARSAGATPLVVEPCTGSGAIALAVLTEVPGARITAGDLDRAAVAVARENHQRVMAGIGVRHGWREPSGRRPRTAPWRPGVGVAPGASLRLVVGDLLGIADPADRGRVDVVVANPPYLPADDASSWTPEVAADPPHALVGGDDGHELVRRLVDEAVGWLAPAGTLVVEIDDRRGDEAAAGASEAGYRDVRVEQDLTGRDRVLVARRPGGRPD